MGSVWKTLFKPKEIENPGYEFSVDGAHFDNAVFRENEMTGDHCVFKFLWEGGGGVLPYSNYIVMCGPKGFGFSAVLALSRDSINKTEYNS